MIYKSVDTDLNFFDFADQFFTDGFIGFVIHAIVVFLICKIFLSIIDKAFDKTANKRGKKAATSLAYVKKTVHTLMWAIAIFIILIGITALSGISKAVLGASSVLAVVVGLAAQETMGNFISGFFLSVYQPFHIGDLITIKDKGITGTVKEVGFRHTVLRTFENTKIVIPNSVMNTAIIEDKEFSDQDYTNFLYFDISYDSDIELAKKIIVEDCLKHPNCVDGRTKKQKENNAPQVAVLVTGLKDYSVELRAAIVSSDVPSGFSMCSDLRETIKKDFDAQGIKIPFPTYTIDNKKTNA